MNTRLLEIEWSCYESRNGDPSTVGSVLERLYSNPDDLALIDELNCLLGTESTTWSAVFPAAQFITEICQMAETKRARSEYGLIIGLLATYASAENPKSPEDCPDEFVNDYREMVKTGRKIILEKLQEDDDPDTIRWYLAAYLGASWSPKLADHMANLDSGCMHCGEQLI